MWYLIQRTPSYTVGFQYMWTWLPSSFQEVGNDSESFKLASGAVYISNSCGSIYFYF